MLCDSHCLMVEETLDESFGVICLEQGDEDADIGCLGGDRGVPRGSGHCVRMMKE